jgi:uncharacterized protein (TIGR00369 family)
MVPIQAPDDEMRARIRAFFDQGIPFNRFLGMQLAALGEGTARMTLPFRPELVGDPFRPSLHGGVIATLLDATGGAAVWSTLSMADRVSTIDIRVDYLRPGRLEALVAVGEIRRVGNRVGVVAIRAFHEDRPEENIAEAMGVYSVRRET